MALSIAHTYYPLTPLIQSSIIQYQIDSPVSALYQPLIIFILSITSVHQIYNRQPMQQQNN